MRWTRGLLAVAAMGIAAATGLAGGVTARAGALPGAFRDSGESPQVVTHSVSAAAQQAAAAFWTPARMKAATAAGTRTTAGTRATAVPRATAGPALLPPPGIPTAVKFNGVRTTGALFFTTGTRSHFCTASVTNSGPGDLVLTAAHCVYRSAYVTNIAYVPDYHSGLRPYGIWPVRVITVALGWRLYHNPNLDFAFLSLSRVGGRQVQAVTGGLSLGLNGSYALPVQVIGYNNTASQPVHCPTRSFEFRPGQLEFYCHGYWTGTSGGPWITGLNMSTGAGVVHGVIGGYEEGGDYEWASYSPYFGSAIAALFQQAQRA